MKNQFVFWLVSFVLYTTNIFSQTFSISQTNSARGSRPSMAFSRVINLKNSGPSKYATVLTNTDTRFLSYCHPSYYICYRNQSLAIFNEQLNLVFYHSPSFVDNFSGDSNRPAGWSSFKNSVSHDVTETKSGSLIVSGALEIFYHDPRPNMDCGDMLGSSKLFVYKTDLTGNISWAFGYDVPVKNSRVVELKNGNIAVVGNDLNSIFFYLLLDAKGRPIGFRHFPDITFNLALELKETTGDFLVIGNSRKYTANQNSNHSDVVCLVFNAKGSVTSSIALGRNLEDAPGAIQFNPFTNKYFLIFNSQSQNVSPAGSVKFDMIGLDIDGLLNISRQVGWRSTRSQMAFDMIIDSSEKSKALTVFGADFHQVGDIHFPSNNFLFQESLDGSSQFSFFTTQNLQGDNHMVQSTGNFYSKTFQLTPLPYVRTSMNVFKTANGEYLLVSPYSFESTVNNPPAYFGNFIPSMQWKQTDLQLKRGNCPSDPIEINRFQPDILSRKISTSFLTRPVLSYSLVSNNRVGGLLDEVIECGSKELLEPVAANYYSLQIAQKLKTNYQLKIYPNPAKETITINMEKIQRLSKVNIRIIDILGREMYSKGVNAAIDGKLTLPIGFLSGGTYFIQAKCQGRVYFGKFIKQSL